MMESLLPAHCTCVRVGDQQLQVVEDLWQVSEETNSQVGSCGMTKQNSPQTDKNKNPNKKDFVSVPRHELSKNNTSCYSCGKAPLARGHRHQA